MTFHYILLVYTQELLAAIQPRTRGLSLVGRLGLLIQYIRSCPPYLKTVFSIRNVRARHAVVTRGTHFTLSKSFNGEQMHAHRLRRDVIGVVTISKKGR
jgi:hypothetical protein